MTNLKFISKCIFQGCLPLSTYKGYKNKIPFRCILCGDIEYATPRQVFRYPYYHCHNCKHLKRQFRFSKELASNGFIRLTKYTTNNTPILIKCPNCNSSFWEEPRFFTSKYLVCPFCSKLLKCLSIIRCVRILGKNKYKCRNILFGSSSTKIQLEHKECGTKWITYPYIFKKVVVVQNVAKEIRISYYPLILGKDS